MRLAVVVTLVSVVLFALLSGGMTSWTAMNDRPIRLEFWTHNAGADAADVRTYWRTLADSFEAEHPRVRVILSTGLDQNLYPQMLGARAVGGSLPDVLIMDDWTSIQLRREGLLSPLNKWIDGDQGFDIKAFPPSMVRDGQSDGKQYSLPWQGGFSCLFVRTDWLAKLGSEPPRTWDDVRRICAALQEEFGLERPFGMDPTDAFMVMPLIWQRGGRIISDDYKTILIDSPETVSALRMVHGFMYDRPIMRPALARGVDPIQLWSTGGLAMMVHGSWLISTMDRDYPQLAGLWTVVPLPYSGQPVRFYGGQHLMMTAHTKHPDLAWAFMRSALSAKGQAAWARSTGMLPANQSSLQLLQKQGEASIYDKLPDLVADGRNNPFAPFFEVIWYERFINRVLQPAMVDPSADIPALLRDGAAQMQRVADKYWATHNLPGGAG